MNTLTYIILLLIAIAAGLSPIFKKIFDQLHLGVRHKQFDLLRKLVEDAVSHVNQIALVEEMPSSKKKELAISIATSLADNFGIPQDKQKSIDNLIESILWSDDSSEDEEDNEFDD